jgi:hypothetical protein
VEVARGHERPSTIVLFHLFLPRPVSEYLSAVDEFGSPAFSEARLVASDEADRAAADQQLAAAEGIKLSPSGAGPTPASRVAGRCRAVSGSATAATVALGPGSYTLRLQRLKGIADQVSLPIPGARFADHPTTDLGAIEPGHAAGLSIPPDRSRLPWRLYWPLGTAGTVCRINP